MIPIDPSTVLAVLAAAERMIASGRLNGQVSDDDIAQARGAGRLSDEAFDEYMADLQAKRAASGGELDGE